MHIETEDLKLVSDYTGLNFKEVLAIDCVTFKMLLKDALVYQLRQTEAGKEYLEHMWILTQSKPDKEALRENFV